MTQPQSAMRSSSGPSGARKSVVWNKELVISEVEAHPDLLTVPTFILFVQKDELAMSRAALSATSGDLGHAVTYLLENSQDQLDQRAPPALAAKRQDRPEGKLKTPSELPFTSGGGDNSGGGGRTAERALGPKKGKASADETERSTKRSKNRANNIMHYFSPKERSESKASKKAGVGTIRHFFS